MNYTLITGASRGIGEALARRCALEGHHLILVARSQERLEVLASELHQSCKIVVQTISLDLLETQATLRLFKICQENNWRIRILINNAGLGLWGTYSEMALVEQMNILRLNALVLAELCHFFTSVLQKEQNSHILNIGSISSFQPVPYLSMYTATKAFVLSFSSSLRIELQPLGIGVSCLCPGLTRSDFFDKAGSAPIISSVKMQMTAEAVAEAAILGMKKNRAVIVPGIVFKLCTFLSRYLPISLTTYILGRILKPTTNIKVA